MKMNEVSMIACKQCGNTMRKTKKDEKNMAHQLLGVIVFIIGVCLLFMVPIGTIIGVILIILGSQMGFKRKNVWKCDACGYYFDRA